MKIFKFGGSSVGTPERINQVIDIVQNELNEGEKLAVVFSAFQHVTDKLHEIGKLALQRNDRYNTELIELVNKHKHFIEVLNGDYEAKVIWGLIDPLFSSLGELCHGIYLIRELTPRTLDLILSFGEKLSCTIISETMRRRGIKAEYLQADKVVKTDDYFGSANVNFELTNRNILQYFATRSATQIITGFIASTKENVTTTLGRGGSDYTASIFGAALDVEEIQIWKDVNGILTSDPRIVTDTKSLSSVTYEEAMELSHFGAKVIYPPTLIPVVKKKIKVRIRNTFNPAFPGTTVFEKSDDYPFAIKGISSINNISLLQLTGSGMMGVTGTAARLFKCLADAKINIILITQASSEHSICFAIQPENGDKARKIVEEEFRWEIREGKVNPVNIEENLSVVAVVGENMKHTPGISGKVFSVLGENSINIHSIAQGSSELNISFVISGKDLKKAISALNKNLFRGVKQSYSIFLAGAGLVGSAFITQLQENKDKIFALTGVKYEIVAIANSRKMYFGEESVTPENYKDLLESSELKSNPDEFVNKLLNTHNGTPVFIDATATPVYSKFYSKLLENGVNIVTPNKNANSDAFNNYEAIHSARNSGKSKFGYGANVGASLPIINTLKNIVESGDTVTKIEGVFSGTLSYIFNSLSKDTNFSDVVTGARDKGMTEPDPRDDLSGLDVARKLLILVRECGIKLDLSDIKVESLVSAEAKKAESVEKFLDVLKTEDKSFANKIHKATEKGKKLAYIAVYENGKATAGIREIEESHPFYNLQHSDNIVSFTTGIYDERPLIIRGPGAGAKQTAFGIISDLTRIAKNNE